MAFRKAALETRDIAAKRERERYGLPVSPLTPPATPATPVTPVARRSHGLLSPPETPSTTTKHTFEAKDVRFTPTTIAPITPPATPLKSTTPLKSITPDTRACLNRILHPFPTEFFVACLQCSLQDRRCSIKDAGNLRKPQCSWCARRLRDHESKRTGDDLDTAPCLKMQKVRIRSLYHGSWITTTETVLLRLPEDGDEVWERKLRAREELLEREELRKDRQNWVLPCPNFYKLWASGGAEEMKDGAGSKEETIDAEESEEEEEL